MVSFKTVAKAKKWIRVTDLVKDDGPEPPKLLPRRGADATWVVKPLKGKEEEGGLVLLETALFKEGQAEDKIPEDEDFDPGTRENVFKDSKIPV